MSYFNANASGVVCLANVETLRFKGNDNTPFLNVVFDLCLDGVSSQIAARLKGEKAEWIYRLWQKQSGEKAWFYINAELGNAVINVEHDGCQNLSLNVDTIEQVMPVESGRLSVDILGRLTRDPERLKKDNDKMFMRLSVAVNKPAISPAGKGPVLFFDVTAFSEWKIREISEKFHKGLGAYIVASMSFYKKGDDINAGLVLVDILSMKNKHSKSKEG